jgi:energy-converting hydrogenase B subunit D
MVVLQLAILVLVAATGTAVVFSRNVESQPIGISFYGLILSLMFFIFQAPDVALSQLVIGAVGLPLMIMLALARLRRPDR